MIKNTYSIALSAEPLLGGLSGSKFLRAWDPRLAEDFIRRVLVLPQYEAITARWMSPLLNGELLFMFWLLIMGAKPKSLADSAHSSAAA